MKKILILLACATLLMVSACSKKEEGQKNTSATEKSDESKKKDSTKASNNDQDKEATETATTDEDTTPDENASQETASTDSEQNQDYLTSNHEFIASELTNLSESQVSQKWGQPIKTEKIKFRYSGTSDFVPAVVNYYQNDKYEVTFVEGKAARLVYTPAEEIPFDDEKEKALELAGLPTDVEDTTDTDSAYVWNNIGGVYEVTCFMKEDLVDYLYIILDEKYK